MEIRHQEAGACWLVSRAPKLRTAEEALKLSDKCWAEGLRLAVIQANHINILWLWFAVTD